MNPSINTSLDEDEFLKPPLTLLWYARLHPLLDSRRSKVQNATNVVLFCVIIALAIKGILVFYKDDISFAAECLQTCFLTSHVVGKMLILRVYRKKILQLVTQRSLFWKPEDFTSATQKECSVFTMRVKKLLRGYYILAFTTLILYDLQPIVGGIVPTACYVPPFSFKYLVVLAWYLSVVACLVICGIDSFFVSLATSLWLQFKLLHYKIKENDICTEESDKQSWKKVKEFVDHHVFLLSYCQKLNIAFQPMFMLQFLLPVANGALGIFISLQPGLWSNRMKSFVYFVRTLGEAAFYCVPAEFLISSANKVCDVVYESNWYELNKEQIKKCFSLVMMKSQKLLVFSAYGLVWINLGTLVVIYKTIFSFFTYLNSAKNMST